MTVMSKNPGRFLPSDMRGKTVLDVGCYNANIAKYCVSKGARKVVAIDAYPRQSTVDDAKKIGFTFITCDVLSERFLMLPQFDIVVCAGVLYHVDNIPFFLARLRLVTKEILFLETLTTRQHEDLPMMLFLAGNSHNDNYSNWWAPTALCVDQLLVSQGFKDLKVLRPGVGKGSRYVVSAIANEDKSLDKIMSSKNTTDSLLDEEEYNGL